LFLQYLTDVTHKRIPGYRFYLPAEVFSAIAEENAGFCQFTSDKYYEHMPNLTYDGINFGSCLPDGLLNVSKCQSNSPVVVSSPHFLYTNGDVVKSITGGPDVTTWGPNDQTLIDLEPITGVGLHFERKLQINVAMAPMRDVYLAKGMKNMLNCTPKVIPVLWLNESAMISDSMAKQVYSKVHEIQIIVKALMYTMIAVGILTIILVILINLLCSSDIIGSKSLQVTEERNQSDYSPSLAARGTFPGPRLPVNLQAAAPLGGNTSYHRTDGNVPF